MAASGSLRGYTSREIRDYVAAVDLPSAARAAKMALDRNAFMPLVQGVVMALGRGGVDEQRAAHVCRCISELMTCAADQRRAAAAELLTAAMKAIKADEPDRIPTMSIALVNAAGTDINMAQPDPDRAAAYAAAMTKTMSTVQVADILAQACTRVSSLHGAARNPEALVAFARCPLFAKTSLPVEVTLGTKALMLACVRAAYVKEPIVDRAKDTLVQALAGPPPKAAVAEKTATRVPDDPFTAVTQCDSAAPASSGGDQTQLPEDLKLSVIWTFVHKDGTAQSAVPNAADVPHVDEVKIVDGRNYLPSKDRQLARVRMVP